MDTNAANNLGKQDAQNPAENAGSDPNTPGIKPPAGATGGDSSEDTPSDKPQKLVPSVTPGHMGDNHMDA